MLYGNGLAARLRVGSEIERRRKLLRAEPGHFLRYRACYAMENEGGGERERARVVVVGASEPPRGSRSSRSILLDFDLPSFLFSIRSLDTSFFFLTHFWLGM